jgi:hypothetical protein
LLYQLSYRVAKALQDTPDVQWSPVGGREGRRDITNRR